MDSYDPNARYNERLKWNEMVDKTRQCLADIEHDSSPVKTSAPVASSTETVEGSDIGFIRDVMLTKRYI